VSQLRLLSFIRDRILGSKRFDVPSILVVLPDFETATYLGSEWIKAHILPILEKHLKVIVLAGADAVKSKFKTLIKKVTALGGVGHGNKDVFTGQNYDRLLTKQTLTEEECKGKWYFPLSCLTGYPGGLAETFVKKGGVCAIAYRDTFAFMYAGHNPPEDPYLNIFLSPVRETWRAMCEGYNELHPCGRAGYLAQKDTWEQIIKQTSGQVRAVAVHDYNALVMYGDGSKRFPTKQPTPTEINVKWSYTERDAGGDKRDINLNVEVRVKGKDDSIPEGGYVSCIIEGYQQISPIDDEGRAYFTQELRYRPKDSFTVSWEVEYQGYSNDGIWEPSGATGEWVIPEWSPQPPQPPEPPEPPEPQPGKKNVEIMMEPPSVQESDRYFTYIRPFTVIDEDGNPLEGIPIRVVYGKKDEIIYTGKDGKGLWMKTFVKGIYRRIPVSFIFEGNEYYHPVREDFYVDVPPVVSKSLITVIITFILTLLAIIFS